MRMRRKAFTGGGFTFAPVITANEYNYDVRARALAAGWDGVQQLNTSITITSSAVVHTMTVPSNFPPGSNISIDVQGAIAGLGGVGGNGGIGSSVPAQAGIPGGTALYVRFPINLKLTGVIAGGGGGGGGGGSGWNNGTPVNGGAGGPGATYPGSAGVGSAGSTGAGTAPNNDQGGAGGNGGAPGQPGAAGEAATFNSGGTPTVLAAGAAGSNGLAIDGGEYVTVDTGSTGSIYGATAFGVNSYIGTPTATPAIGAALDGGYYAGLLWGQVAQTASQLQTGALYTTLIVPEAVGNPLFYSGQSITLRSRANPATSANGSITGCANGLVSWTAATVIGGGFIGLSDISLMAHYRIVVAPKASGEASLAVAASTLPLDAYNVTEPKKAGAAMRAAGDATAYPAAHWAAGLNIGGKTDWEVPTRDVLERAWRYLKPNTNNNYATADRATGPANSYTRFGAFGSVTSGHGNNADTPNSTGTTYSTASPARTSVSAFIAGNAEAFDAVDYVTASAYDASSVWAQRFGTTAPGKQVTVAKDAVLRVRAFRRSII